MKPLPLAIFVSLSLVCTSHAQSVNTRKLDSLFDMLEKHGLANGTLAIALNGKPVYQRAVGFAFLDNAKTQTGIDTKYRIGSVSKMFTAVMIFQLIDEGKLGLYGKLGSFFPQIPNADKITIENMLYHRSGLHDYTKDTNFPEWMDKQRSTEELIGLIAEKGPDFEPNSKADYSNTNYLLLGYIIEKVCKMPYADAVQQRIVSKIGLSNTYYGQPIDVGKHEAASYKYAAGKWTREKETNPDIHRGAGSMVSTAHDLAVFIRSLFVGRLVSETSLSRMTRVVDGYGMGIFPFDFAAVKGYGHNGRIEEFYSAVRYYPKQKLALAYVTNGILYPRNDILDAVLKICFNNNYTIPFSAPVNATQPNLSKYTGIYSSPDLPFKVTCKTEKEILRLEIPGKSMEVVMINNDYFMNLESGTFFEFDPTGNGLQIKETDNVYFLRREKR